MLQKCPVDVQTIKYLDQEIQIIVKTNGKAFIINEIQKEDLNFVLMAVALGPGIRLLYI